MWLFWPTPRVFSIQNILWMIFKSNPWIFNVVFSSILLCTIRLRRTWWAENDPWFISIPTHYLIFIHNHPIFSVSGAKLKLIEFYITKIYTPGLRVVILLSIYINSKKLICGWMPWISLRTLTYQKPLFVRKIITSKESWLLRPFSIITILTSVSYEYINSRFPLQLH